MNIESEPEALMALMKKYKPTPQDFVLARLAARVEVLETLIIGVAHPLNEKMRIALGEKTIDDLLCATENYLKLLCQTTDAGDDSYSISVST